MGEWWINGSQQNLLKGIEGSEDNPPLLPREWIQDFLIRIPDSRASFLRLVHTLLPEEQDRVIPLYNYAVKNPTYDPHNLGDARQSYWVKRGVRLEKPRG